MDVGVVIAAAAAVVVVVVMVRFSVAVAVIVAVVFFAAAVAVRVAASAAAVIVVVVAAASCFALPRMSTKQLFAVAFAVMCGYLTYSLSGEQLPGGSNCKLLLPPMLLVMLLSPWLLRPPVMP